MMWRIVSYSGYLIYRIEGNFYMVQTFAVFADDPTATKIKIGESFNDPVGTMLSIALSQI